MSSFLDKGYDIVKEMLDISRCDLTFSALRMGMAKNPFNDGQCPLSHAEYAAPVAEALLVLLHPVMQAVTGLSLLPTYSYSRIYRPNDILTAHRDRPACEVSCTLHVGRFGVDESWPIFIEGTSILQDIGDAVVYRGCDVTHWRDEWIAPKGSLYGQVFLHYVDENGPYAEWQFDTRPSLGVIKNGKVYNN